MVATFMAEILIRLRSYDNVWAHCASPPSLCVHAGTAVVSGSITGVQHSVHLHTAAQTERPEEARDFLPNQWCSQAWK